MQSYDAILVVSFGGPEGKEDVIPFLQNVLRGKNVPISRMEEVAHHYYHFGGVSPINSHCRVLIAALRAELDRHEIRLPIYWGNRNWHPLLEDTVRAMAFDGIKKVLAFFTSAYSSYSSCRQYLEDVTRAQCIVGDSAPSIDKIRSFYNHPNFIEVNAENLDRALQAVPVDRRELVHVAFTAHSIPTAMARNCPYEMQLQEACRLVAAKVNQKNWQLVFQSRSGPPSQPWLGPDIGDHLRELRVQSIEDVVILPIGFITDHMEVIYDLDIETAKLADEIGINMIRAATAGAAPRFIEMIRLLIEERLSPSKAKFVILGNEVPPDACPPDCCPSGAVPVPNGPVTSPG